MRRSVVFDLDGVLVDGWHSLPEKRKAWDASILEDMGIDREALQKHFFHENGIFVREVLSGRKGLRDALAEILPLCGPSTDVDAFIAYWLERDSQVRKPLLDVVAKLKASDKVRLYIATNNEETRMTYMWETIGLKKVFDDKFYAGEFKVLKPDASFFMQCEARMEKTGTFAPLFFDDSPAYCEGARARGWEAVVFTDLSDCTNHPFIREVLENNKPPLSPSFPMT